MDSTGLYTGFFRRSFSYPYRVYSQRSLKELIGASSYLSERVRPMTLDGDTPFSEASLDFQLIFSFLVFRAGRRVPVYCKCKVSFAFSRPSSSIAFLMWVCFLEEFDSIPNHAFLLHGMCWLITLKHQ